MRKVEVVPYNHQWIEMFDDESTILTEIFNGELIAIHHIGSTSIPGMSAKPIIDILVEVKNIVNVDNLNDSMRNKGYEARGENGIPGRRYFMKEKQDKDHLRLRTHHVHVFEAGDKHSNRHIIFRDYLIANPTQANLYSTLKEELAIKFPFDIESYISGKDSLVKELESKAQQWSRTL